MIRKSIAFIFIAFAGISMALAQNNNVENIIPQPESVVMGNRNSAFEFNTKTRIVYDWNKNDTKLAIQELDRITSDIFGKKLSKGTKAHGENNVIFRYDG